ncbi:hypothetical protein Hanom_Chr09g00819571 [Helianthus anomalus]
MVNPLTRKWVDLDYRSAFKSLANNETGGYGEPHPQGDGPPHHRHVGKASRGWT